MSSKTQSGDKSSLRVMVVDGITSSRRDMTEALSSCEGVEVVGTAINARTALGKLRGYTPDIVAIDVSTADVDGIELAKNLVSQGGLGVVLMADDVAGAQSIRSEQGLGCCGVLARGARASDSSMLTEVIRGAWHGAGRVSARSSSARGGDPVSATVPSRGASAQDPPVKEDPSAKAVGSQPAVSPSRAAVARATNVSRHQPTRRAPAAAKSTESRSPPGGHVARKPIELVAICTSTGGPEALGKVLPLIPGDFPRPILIVQHMPPGFTASLAASLDRASNLAVREACDGEAVAPGTAYLAPGGQHLGVAVRDGKRVVVLSKDSPENSCRPAADYLLRSLSGLCGGGVLVVMMTGMGEDGLKGCLDLHSKGATIFAQDEASCVVYGMPRGPVERGLASVVAPVESLASHICRSVEKVAIHQ